MWLHALLVSCFVLVALTGCLDAPDSLPEQGPSLVCDPCKRVVDALPGPAWEPHIAVHPEDPDHVAIASRVFESGVHPADFTLHFDIHVSRDGGGNWTLSQLRASAPIGRTTDPGQGNVVGDPVLAFLPDGTLLIAGATLHYVPLPTGGGILMDVRLWVARSPNGGYTFEEPVVVDESEGLVVMATPPAPLPPVTLASTYLPDKPWIATGPEGEVLLAWVPITAFHPARAPSGWGSDIVVADSGDGGRSWSDPLPVAQAGSYTGPAVGIGSDGSWWVAYLDRAENVVLVAHSLDQGATWETLALGAGGWMPALAVDRGVQGADRILVTVGAPVDPPSGADTEGTVHEIVTHLFDGTAWSRVVIDKADAPGRALPSATFDDEGTAFVSYGIATASGAAYWAAAMTPDGEVFRVPLDGAIAGPPSRMGDYLGAAGADLGAYAVWVTTSDAAEYDTAWGRFRLASGEA